MDVKNPLHLAHGEFLWRIEKNHPVRHDHPGQRYEKVDCGRKDFAHKTSVVSSQLSVVSRQFPAIGARV
jgi:hypothetical protein